MLRSARASDPSRPSRASARVLSARCRRSSGVLALASASSSSSGSTTARSCCTFALRACFSDHRGDQAHRRAGRSARRRRPRAAGAFRRPRSHHAAIVPQALGYRPPRRPASSSARSATTARDTPVLSPPTSEVGVCCASRLAGLAWADAAAAPVVAASPLNRALVSVRPGRWAPSPRLARSRRSASFASSAIRASSRRHSRSTNHH
jgi:hypothetical protein